MHVTPHVSGRSAQAQCPVCGFENLLQITYVTYSPIQSFMCGRNGYWSILWDDPASGHCEHLLKYVVEKAMMVFAEDWEVTAVAMGAQLFQFPYVDGVPEDLLLKQCQWILEWQERDPEGYRIWLRQLRR